VEEKGVQGGAGSGALGSALTGEAVKAQQMMVSMGYSRAEAGRLAAEGARAAKDAAEIVSLALGGGRQEATIHDPVGLRDVDA
jgi:hypothetical protein